MGRPATKRPVYPARYQFVVALAWLREIRV
jgi:hypothetical protein